jgi:parallel beta-helix repeat protein
VNKRNLGVTLAVCVAAAGAISQQAVAATLCVAKGGGACFSTIGAAVAAANPGDTIQVSQGTYAEDVIIGKSLSLIGKNSANTKIDATGLANGINIDGLDNPGLSNVTVSGFTVENANFEGIVITNASNVTISGNHVTNNDKSLNFATASCPGLPSWETAEGEDCGEGVHLNGVDHSTVSNNQIDGNSGGILISDETAPNHDNQIIGNSVKGNVFDCGITMASHPRAAAICGPTGPCAPPPAPFGIYSNTIAMNDASGNGLNGVGAGIGMFGFLPGARVSDNQIIDNNVTGNGIPGISMHAHAPFGNFNNNVITGNYISGNGADGEDAATPGPTGINIFGISTITGTVISQNVIKNEAYDVVIHISPIPPSALTTAVNQNDLNGSGVGVANLGTTSVDASNNWWGCAHGPGANGCSSAFGSNLTTTPFLSSPAVPNGH